MDISRRNLIQGASAGLIATAAGALPVRAALATSPVSAAVSNDAAGPAANRNRRFAGEGRGRIAVGHCPQHQARGSVRAIDIDGGVTTHGEGIAPLELQGVIGQLSVNGGIAMAAAKQS